MRNFSSANASEDIYAKEIAEATLKIEASPGNPDSYTSRMNIYNKARKYKEAAGDLAKQCELTTNDDVRELCLDELAEYRKVRGLLK